METAITLLQEVRNKLACLPTYEWEAINAGPIIDMLDVAIGRLNTPEVAQTDDKGGAQ